MILPLQLSIIATLFKLIQFLIAVYNVNVRHFMQFIVSTRNALDYSNVYRSFFGGCMGTCFMYGGAMLLMHLKG